MKLICAWCGDTIDHAGYSQGLDPNTSHGMCPACHVAFVSQELGVSLDRHIDSIPIPILLVDGGNTVLAMNAKASEMLGEKSDATAKRFFGQVFDCVHSRLPEGCGRTIHCLGCAIRRSVSATFETGEPQILIPATLSIENSDQPTEAVMTITTVKRDGIVLLRIEERGSS